MPHIDLLELPYFEGISIDYLVALVDMMKPEQFHAKEVILREGEPTPPKLFIATSGTLVITKHAKEGECRLAELRGPTIFGEVELFCAIPPAATVTASTEVSAFSLPRPTFLQLVSAQHPAIVRFCFNVARVACHRLAVADHMIATVMGPEDLISLRRTTIEELNPDPLWSQITGVFRGIRNLDKDHEP